MAIFNLHHPLIMIFGILGNIVSTGVYFAPVPTFIEIWKEKSTMGFESLPYVVSLFSSLLWLYYSLIKQGDAFLLITINALGSFIELVYVIIFIVYATPTAKKKTYNTVGAGTALCVMISVGTFYGLKGSLLVRASVVGWFCVAVSIAVFAAPLTILVQVVKTKSVEFMPITLSCFLTLSAIMWFSYGLFTQDKCVMVPNVLGFVLGVFQMGIYKYYKYKSIRLQNIKDHIKLPAEHHIINIKITNNSEVVPVDSSRTSGSNVEELEEKTREDKRGGENDEIVKGLAKVVMDHDEPCGVEIVTHVKPNIVIMCAA